MEKIIFKPIKPKDASTLIIIKNDKKNTYVLMGQRSTLTGATAVWLCTA